MDQYMGRKLLDLHDAGSKFRFKEKAICFICAVLFIILLPYLHIGVFYAVWSSDKPSVDRDKCTCDCFDTIFRGRYEWPPSAYKHIYFNATHNTLIVWIILVLGVLAAYESLRYITQAILARRVRTAMLALYISSIYPHYYGWWGLFSYQNEDYYPQWYHQIFFTVTELICTALVVYLINSQNRLQAWQLLAILSINTVHIIIASLDQFIDNIIHGRGAQFEAVRDFALMIPDVFHVLVAYFELGALAQKSQVSVFRLFFREELLAAGLFIILMSLLGKNL